ncbi:vitamin K epoxide reductase family protein [Flavobacterium sp.]|uniref:vitamin K epoxide reductase family protein n=1 Tax=Flavobacterium sp. TaxID=239 RepID=UPI00263576C8|nr:vitamin K epoxide reductase family protein [Flavobacterium sp.]
MPSFINLINDFLLKNSHFLNKEDLNLQLLSHEDYPSFRSVSDTFDYFGIENLAATVPIEALEQLPEFFLTLINIEGKSIFVSAHKTQNRISCKSTEKKLQQYSYADFKKIWSGTIIVVEKNTAPSNTKNRQTLVFLGIAAALTLLTLLYPFSLIATVIGLLAIIGIYISWLITKEELGIRDTITATLCSTLNEKGSCSNIINSKVRFLGLISLSTATGVFFVSQLMVLLFIGFDTTFFSIALFAAIPALLYSLYSQAYVLKEWCALCLATALLLVLEMGFVFTAPLIFTFNAAYWIKALLFITLVHLGINYTKALIEKNIALKKSEMDFFKFKRNYGLFTSLLYKKQLTNNTSIPQQHHVRFGSDNPVLTIQAVTNPLCGYCTDAFKAYYTLLEKYGTDIQIQFIFSVPYEKPDMLSTKIALAVLDAYSHNPKQALLLLKDWFDKKDISKWENKSGNPSPDKLQLLQSHRNWCDTNGILYTPATFINSYYYPNEYKTQEFILFADEMIEQFRETNILVTVN